VDWISLASDREERPQWTCNFHKIWNFFSLFNDTLYLLLLHLHLEIQDMIYTLQRAKSEYLNSISLEK
jgi:hypothetical protein